MRLGLRILGLRQSRVRVMWFCLTSHSKRSSITCFCTHNPNAQINSKGPPRGVSACEILKSTGFHLDFGFQIGFLYFTWISGLLDFKVDFYIIFKVDLGFLGGAWN